MEYSYLRLLPDAEPLSPADSNAGSNLSRCMRHINGIYTRRYNRSVIERLKKRRQTDHMIKARVEKLQRMMNKSQAEI